MFLRMRFKANVAVGSDRHQRHLQILTQANQPCGFEWVRRDVAPGADPLYELHVDSRESTAAPSTGRSLLAQLFDAGAGACCAASESCMVHAYRFTIDGTTGCRFPRLRARRAVTRLRARRNPTSSPITSPRRSPDPCRGAGARRCAAFQYALCASRAHE